MTVARILIPCPTTDQLVYTGVAINAENFATALLPREQLLCPACRQMHWWGKREAQLEQPAERETSV